MKEIMRLENEMNYIAGDTKQRHVVKRENWDYDDETSTTRKPVIINPEHLQLYRAACNKSLELYQLQKRRIGSIKEKYFQQLTNKGIEIKKFLEILFRCEDIVEVETRFITENYNVNPWNFTEWTEPLEKLQVVKLLHNWKESILCIDTQKGDNPPETIVTIRKQALEAFEEIAPWYEVVQKLMSELPKGKEKENKGKNKDKDECLNNRN